MTNGFVQYVDMFMKEMLHQQSVQSVMQALISSKKQKEILHLLQNMNMAFTQKQ